MPRCLQDGPNIKGCSRPLVGRLGPRWGDGGGNAVVQDAPLPLPCSPRDGQPRCACTRDGAGSCMQTHAPGCCHGTWWHVRVETPGTQTVRLGVLTAGLHAQVAQEATPLAGHSLPALQDGAHVGQEARVTRQGRRDLSREKLFLLRPIGGRGRGCVNSKARCDGIGTGTAGF